jgi:hypothetical protein
MLVDEVEKPKHERQHSRLGIEDLQGRERAAIGRPLLPSSARLVVLQRAFIGTSQASCRRFEDAGYRIG